MGAGGEPEAGDGPAKAHLRSIWNRKLIAPVMRKLMKRCKAKEKSKK